MPSTTEKAMMDNEDLPEAAPAFAAHFSNPVYDDPAGEFAPFGSDEGFDMLYEWAERRDELVRFVDEADVRWGSLGHSLPAGGAVYRWPRRHHAAINPPISMFASLTAASASIRSRTLL